MLIHTWVTGDRQPIRRPREVELKMRNKKDECWCHRHSVVSDGLFGSDTVPKVMYFCHAKERPVRLISARGGRSAYSTVRLRS